MKFLLFLTFAFLSTSLQAQKTLEDAKEFVKTHTPEEIASSLFDFIREEASFEAIIHLVENGADVNAQNQLGNKVIHLIANNKKIHYLNLLLKKGADINAQNKYGYQAIHSTIFSAQTHAFNTLLDRGADIFIETLRGPALLIAISKGNSFFVSRLLDKDASNINARDRLGSSALNLACEKGDPFIVEMLLNQGVDVDIQSLRIAANMGNLPIFKLLKKSFKNNYGDIEDQVAKGEVKAFLEKKRKSKTAKKPKIKSNCNQSFQ